MFKELNYEEAIDINGGKDGFWYTTLTGAASGAKAGATLGAKCGTVVPGKGNVVGAIAGGLSGAIIGFGTSMLGYYVIPELP